MNIDLILFHWLNSWSGVSPFFDWLIVFQATYFWGVIMALVVCFALATFFPLWHAARVHGISLFIFALVSAFLARFVFTELIRFFYIRPRPFMVLEDVMVLKHQLFGEITTSGSFPSGHAALAFAVATTISFYYPKTSVLFFLAAFSIGMGRVAAGVHWPSDILGGAIVGLVSAFVVNFAWNKYKRRLSRQI